MKRLAVLISLLLALSLVATATAAGPEASNPTQTSGVSAAVEPGAKAKEVLSGLIEKFATLLPEEARATGALEASLKAITDGLQQAGQAKDSLEAQNLAASDLNSKRAAGKARKGELDVLALIREKQGKLDDAAAVLTDRVAIAPADLEGYKALGRARKQLGINKGIVAFTKGKEVAFDVRPVIKEGRTLVPVRAITEALGAAVAWDPATRSVTITATNKVIVLSIDSRTVTVNGVPATLDVPAAILEGRTVIPVRFVAEALSLKVDWVGETETIVIN